MAEKGWLAAIPSEGALAIYFPGQWPRLSDLEPAKFIRCAVIATFCRAS